MTIEDLQKLHQELTKEGHDLLCNKGNDYSGHTETDTLANIKSCGQFGIPPLQGIVTRLLDKMSRLASFSKGVENKVKDDTVKDAVIDIINYAVIWYAVRKEEEDKKVLEKLPPVFTVPPPFTPSPTQWEITTTDNTKESDETA